MYEFIFLDSKNLRFFLTKYSVYAEISQESLMNYKYLHRVIRNSFLTTGTPNFFPLIVLSPSPMNNQSLFTRPFSVRGFFFYVLIKDHPLLSVHGIGPFAPHIFQSMFLGVLFIMKDTFCFKDVWGLKQGWPMGG